MDLLNCIKETILFNGSFSSQETYAILRIKLKSLTPQVWKLSKLKNKKHFV